MQIIAEFQKIYERLDIKDLKEVGESFYQSRMQEVVKELKEKVLLSEDEGAQLFSPTELICSNVFHHSFITRSSL